MEHFECYREVYFCFFCFCFLPAWIFWIGLPENMVEIFQARSPYDSALVNKLVFEGYTVFLFRRGSTPP